MTGHAEEKQMVSWTLHRCHLQAPGVWLDGHKGCDVPPNIQTASRSWRLKSTWPQHPLETRLTLRDLGRYHLSDLRGEFLQELFCAHLSKGQVTMGLFSYQRLT